MQKNDRLRSVIDFLKLQEKMTNDQLGGRMGYRTKSYLSDILGGSKDVTSLFKKRLKEVFGVNPDYIDGQSEEMFSGKIESNFQDTGDGRSHKSGQSSATAQRDLSNLIETGRINAIALDKFADSAKANSENQAELIKIIKNSATAYADPRTAEESSALQVVLMDSVIELLSAVKKKPVSEMKKVFHKKVKEVRLKVEKTHSSAVPGK